MKGVGGAEARSGLYHGLYFLLRGFGLSLVGGAQSAPEPRPGVQ